MIQKHKVQLYCQNAPKKILVVCYPRYDAEQEYAKEENGRIEFLLFKDIYNRDKLGNERSTRNSSLAEEKKSLLFYVVRLTKTLNTIIISVFITIINKSLKLTIMQHK